MIIVEETDCRKTRWPNPEPNVAAATSSTPLIPAESPPAYTPREVPGPSSSSVPPYSNPPPTTQKRRPKPAAARFLEALFVALGVYAATVFVVKSFMHMIDGPPHDPRKMVGKPEPEDGRAIHCVKGRGRSWSPSSPPELLTFDIPLNSSAIYILARGRQTTGEVKVVPHQRNSDEITVEIVTQYHEWDTFMGTTICLMERKEGERGVGIFSPKRLTWTNRMSEVEVTVKIPHQQATPILELLGFEILTPDFQVTLPNADSFVNFRNLTIHTSNKAVVVGSVKATNIDIQTSNDRIHGTFITNSSLSLRTSNAAITPNILLENDSTSGKETFVNVTTTNGFLAGAITLLSNTGTPRYTVHAATSNAGLKLDFLQPSDSSQPSSTLPILDIVGNTSGGSAELSLQPYFEGLFDITTSPTSQAGFSLGSTPKNDPLGLGRQQHVDFMTNVESRKEGRVYWGDLDGERKLGRVELSTSNGPASLHIQ